MKFKGTITTSQDVEIPEQEIKRAAYKMMCKQLNFPEGVFIDDGMLVVEYEERGGSHSWWEKRVVREATEDDLAVARVLAMLAWWR